MLATYMYTIEHYNMLILYHFCIQMENLVCFKPQLQKNVPAK